MEMVTCEQYVISELEDARDKNDELEAEAERLRLELQTLKAEAYPYGKEMTRRLTDIGRKEAFGRCLNKYRLPFVYAKEKDNRIDVTPGFEEYWLKGYDAISPEKLREGMTRTEFAQVFGDMMRDWYDAEVTKAVDSLVDRMNTGSDEEAE